MNKVFVLCATIAALLAVAFASEGFHEIAAIDCNGQFTMLGSHDLLRTRMGTPIKGLVDFVINEVLKMGQCYCPTLTMNDFDRVFMLGQAFNGLRGPAYDKTVPCTSTDATWLHDVWKYGGYMNSSKVIVNMPSGCDLASWQAGTPCLIKQAMPALDITVNFAYGKCANSYFPWASATCSGANCAKIMMPCNSASECGIIPCTPLGPVCGKYGGPPPEYPRECTKYVLNWTSTDMFLALNNSMLYDNGDKAPGCYPADKFFEDIISRARSHFRQTTTPYVFSQNGLNTLRFCFNLDDAYIFNYVNTTGPSDLNTSFTISMNDITCKIVPNAADYHYLEVTCDSVKAWDGQLDDGRGSVTAQNRLDGSVFPELTVSTPTATATDAKLLASTTCDGEWHVLPSNGRLHMFAKAPWLNEHIPWFFNEIYAMERCRAQDRYSDMSWDNFRIRFFDIIGMLYQFVLPAPAVDIPSWSIPAMSDWSPDSTSKIVLPATCTYDSWKNDGLCAVQWTGLESMLKVGITLRAYAKSCGAFKFPEVKVECVGKGCDLLLDPQFCTDTAGCPTNSDCVDIYDMIYLDNENTTIRNFWQAWYKLNTSVTPDTCSSEDTGRKGLRNIINYYKGLPSDGKSETKICMVNFTDIAENFNFTLWSEAQVTADGDRVTLNTLMPWNPAGVVPVTPPPAFYVGFTVQGNSGSVQDILNEAYPNAEITVTSSDGTAQVLVKLTGASAESDAKTLASDVKNSDSPLSTKLTKSGAVTQSGTVEVNSDPTAVQNQPPFNKVAAAALTVSFATVAAALIASLLI